MATYLLDTHTLLWFLERSPNLSETAFDHIVDVNHRVYVSVASYWEMTIKSSLDKLKLPAPVSTLIQKAEDADFGLLAISSQHLEALHGLPYHHRDPFDRLMIAQAQVVGASIISKDRAFEHYDVHLIW